MNKADVKPYKTSDGMLNCQLAAEHRLAVKADIINEIKFVDVKVRKLAYEFHEIILNQAVIADIKDRRMAVFNKGFLLVLQDKKIDSINEHLVKEILERESNAETIRVMKSFIAFLSEHSELSAIKQLAALASFVNYNTGIKHIIDYVDDIDNVVYAYVSGKQYISTKERTIFPKRRAEEHIHAVNSMSFLDSAIKNMCVDFLNTCILTQSASSANMYAKVLSFKKDVLPFLQTKRMGEVDVYIVKEIYEKATQAQTANVLKSFIKYLSEPKTRLPAFNRFAMLNSIIGKSVNIRVIIEIANDIDNLTAAIDGQTKKLNDTYRLRCLCAKKSAIINNLTFANAEMKTLCGNVLNNILYQNISDTTKNQKLKAFNNDILPIMQCQYIEKVDVHIIKEILYKSRCTDTLQITKSLIGMLAECSGRLTAKVHFVELSYAVKLSTSKEEIVQYVNDIISSEHLIPEQSISLGLQVSRNRMASFDNIVNFIESLIFVDPEMYNICIEFVNRIRSLSCVDDVKYKKVLAFKNDILPVLQRLQVCDADELLIKKILENSKYVETVRVIEALISFLSENIGKLIISKQLVALNYVITNKTGKKDILEYIDNIDNIGRYYKYYDDIYGTVVLYIDTDVTEIRESLIACYLERRNNRNYCRPFMSNFNQSAGITIESIYDLTFDIMLQQAKYIENIYKDHEKNKFYKHCSFIKEFYLYVQKNYIPDFFEKAKIPTNVVYRFRFMKEMLIGYLPLHENYFEPTPKADRWLLIYDSSKVINSQITTCDSIEFDFTIFKNELYRQTIKNFIWKETKSVGVKQSQIYALKDFFDFVENLNTKKIISVYVTKMAKDKISEGMILAYKDYLHQKFGYDNNYFLDQLYCIKDFIKYIQEASPDIIDGNILFHLSNLYAIKNNTAVAMNDDELTAVATAVNNNQDTVSETLSAIVFYLIIATEIRPTQILSLSVDSVQEANKKGQYVIISKTKMSGIGEVPQPITIETKRSIDTAIKLTQSYRDKCDSSLKKFIFILPDSRLLESRNRFKLLTTDAVNKYLAKCCNIAKIHRVFTLANFRDTHITLAREHVLRNNLSQLNQMVLSGHNNIFTDSDHYIDRSRELTLALEAANHIIIGNVDLVGKVINKGNMNVTDIVEHGCGYCSSYACNMKSFLGCLMCNYFVTMPSRISYFFDYIKLIDAQIESKAISHDKEDLVNIKRLLVAYLRELLAIKDSDSDGK